MRLGLGDDQAHRLHDLCRVRVRVRVRVRARVRVGVGYPNPDPNPNDDLLGVGPHRGLSRGHDGVGAIEYGAGHVAHLVKSRVRVRVMVRVRVRVRVRDLGLGT